jgi:Transposase, Mutator family
MEQVLDTVEVGRSRRDADEPRLISEEQAEALIAQAREHGVELLGEQGLLRQMTKAVLERALAEELTDHLGYELGDPAGVGSGNSRNGYSAKTLLTDAGRVELEVPRDRNGSHEPKIVRKGQRRLEGIDKIVMGLYARGMTVRDIRAHLVEIYDIEVSPDLISKITDAVLEEVKDWQSRPLEPGQVLANVANHCGVRCRSHRCMASCGVRSPRHKRGRSFSSAAMLSSSSAVQALRSVPFGKYCRSRPFVFSLVGRCHGECGSAK